MKNKLEILGLAISVFMILCACNPQTDKQATSTPTIESTPSVVSIDNISCSFETILPAEISSDFIDISGKSPQNLDFSLDADSTIRFFWDQVSRDNFILSIINLDPNYNNNPERKMIIESIIGPSSGCVDINILAGNYSLNIESADSDWVVHVQSIIYKK